MLQVLESTRVSMMDLLVNTSSGLIRGGTDTYIYFYDSNDNLLCRVKYDEIAQEGVDLATFVFEDSTMSPSTVLSGSVETSGTATKFKILSYGSVDPDDWVVQGTVGEYNSDSDMEFNATTWNEEDAISISNLTIQLPNG